MKTKDKKDYPPLWKQLRNVALVIIVLMVLPSINDIRGIIRLLALGLILWGLYSLNRQHHIMERIQPYMRIILRLISVLGMIAFIAYLSLETNPEARLNAFLIAALVIALASIFLIDYSVHTHGRVFRAESSWQMRLAALLAAFLLLVFGGILIAYSLEGNEIWMISCIVLGFVLLIYSLGATSIVDPLNEIEDGPPKDVGEAIRFFLKRLMK